MIYYGYTKDKTKLPKDIGDELKLSLKDGSIVYGYKGGLSKIKGVAIMTQKEFIVWLDKNLKQKEI